MDMYNKFDNFFFTTNLKTMKQKGYALVTDTKYFIHSIAPKETPARFACHNPIDFQSILRSADTVLRNLSPPEPILTCKIIETWST